MTDLLKELLWLDDQASYGPHSNCLNCGEGYPGPSPEGPHWLRAALRERGVHLVTVDGLAKALRRLYQADMDSGADRPQAPSAAAILAALEEEA